MSKLINDVLNYSKLSYSKKDYTEIDLNKVFEAVTNDFELMIQEKNATIRSGNLPTVSGIPLQLTQLFYNLMSNALKFCDKSPLIDISSKKLLPDEVNSIPQLNHSLNYYQILFSDNGIGFDQKYATQIFTIFKRLNWNHSSYEGTGIGLALCNKIVENHNGFICAKGEENKGATFEIYLPE